MSVPREDAKTVLIWGFVSDRNFRFQGVSAMNCAEAFTAEANAIISASRDQMIGSSLYLTGVEADTGEYVKNPTAAPCVSE